MECEGLETLCIKDQTLTNESMLYSSISRHDDLPVLLSLLLLFKNSIIFCYVLQVQRR